MNSVATVVTMSGPVDAAKLAFGLLVFACNILLTFCFLSACTVKAMKLNDKHNDMQMAMSATFDIDAYVKSLSTFDVRLHSVQPSMPTGTAPAANQLVVTVLSIRGLWIPYD